MRYDAIVVGGSYAGLSAAIYLARARWSVCVIDVGLPRNRFSPAAHGFFGQDGAAPGDMIAQARAQLELYPSVTVRHATAQAARVADDGFLLTLDTGDELSGVKLVLAFGIVDILPDVPGVAERWGKTVLHCPYCHGYEFSGRDLGVLATGPMSAHQARMIANWGPTTFFLHGQPELDPKTLAELQSAGVRIERTPVADLIGVGAGLEAVRLTDGRQVGIEALYMAPGLRLSSPIAEQLGCALEDGPAGRLVKVDASMMTSVPGVYAAGDLARPFGNAMLAAADGVLAGGAASGALIFAQPPRH
jgi:thioredoxin reductase